MATKTKTAAQRQFEADDYVTLLENVIRELSTQAWFAKQGWIGRASLFTKLQPAVASTHIFKPHWFNSQGQGIHFETFVGPKEARKREVAVVLHLLHTPTIPGTRLKRIALSKRVVDECFAMVAGWPGYQFKVGKYGTQPFTCRLKYRDDTELGTALVAEFTRLCRNLGPIVDSKLTELGLTP